MKKLHTLSAGLLLAATLAGSMAVTVPAQASANGRKNTTLVLGAIAVQQLLTGKTTTGLLAGAATALAYDKYKDAKKDEDRRDRWQRDRRDRYETHRHSGNERYRR